MFDVHSHKIEAQTGGFLLAIEGEKNVPGGMSYEDLLSGQFDNSYFLVPYVTKSLDYKDAICIYIHARREGFSASFVERFLKNHEAQLVIIDTFNKFKWSIMDYFRIVNGFPEKKFLLAHGGGYEISEFIQLVRYSNNAYIDFSATQSIFSCHDPKNTLERLCDGVIRHAVTEKRIRDKVLFGSDNPEFSQMVSLEYYYSINKYIPEMMDSNFMRLVSDVF